MKIYIGGDHTGFEVKEQLKKYLTELGNQVEDKGSFSYDKDDDYPDFIRPVAEAVTNDEGSFGLCWVVVVREKPCVQIELLGREPLCFMERLFQKKQ